MVEINMAFETSAFLNTTATKRLNNKISTQADERLENRNLKKDENITLYIFY